MNFHNIDDISGDDRLIELRRSGWTDCVVKVVDIGSHSFWGFIVDKRTGVVVGAHAFEIDGGWYPAGQEGCVPGKWHLRKMAEFN